MAKNNNKKFNKKRIVIFILLLIFVIYWGINYLKNNDFFNELNSNFNFSDIVGYRVIKLDKNPNYSGVGQEKVKNKDGYFTTFTTENNYKKIYKEYKQNGNSSWADNEYWNGSMAENGCGITVMSILLSGYGKDYTPEDLREMYYPVMDYEKMSSELSETFGIKNSDFYYDSEHLSNKSIIHHLQSNRPIIVCVWNNPSDNRWTTASHYMLLLAADNDNMVYVSNPNGLENDSKSSGWYDIDEITPYIAKTIFDYHNISYKIENSQKGILFTIKLPQ